MRSDLWLGVEIGNAGFHAFEEFLHFNLGPLQLPAVAKIDFLDPIEADFEGLNNGGQKV